MNRSPAPQFRQNNGQRARKTLNETGYYDPDDSPEADLPPGVRPLRDAR